MEQLTPAKPRSSLNIEQFRSAGYAAVDWVAEYLASVDARPVKAPVAPGDIRARLPPHPPEHGEPFEPMLRDLDKIVVPGITHWQSPNFYGYFPANASPPAVLGDLISSGLGVQGMLWATSPAATELETHVLDWMVDALDLPSRFRSTGAGGGVIQDTASSATLVAMIAARERSTNGSSNDDGVRQPLVAYASTEAHSSVEKAAGIAGIGRRNVRQVDVDSSFAMRPDDLERTVVADKAAGRQPFFVAATVGTTSSTAVDPVPAIGEICRQHGLWLHVDAAHAGSAAVCPEFRWLNDGLDGADSYCFNPHKWLLTNFDCDCFYVASRGELIRSLSILPEYLKNPATEAGTVIDYRDWQIPLGRRFRALKLWFVVRSYGLAGLRTHIRNGVALAQELAAWVEADADFQLAVPPPLNLVCFRHRDGDEFNLRLVDAINASGRIYLNHTRLNDRVTLRMAIGGTYTERRHVEHAWTVVREVAAALRLG